MGEYLAMPDPCPHVTRMALIRARLGAGDKTLDELYEHIQECPEARD